MKLTWRLAVPMVLCLFYPVQGEAGKFVIEDVWYVKNPGIDRTHVRVGSRARYEGALDTNDHNWAIEAHLFVGGVPYYGSPTNGDTIDPNMVIECPDTIGGFHEFDNCPVVSYYGKGLVAIYHQFSPDIDTDVAPTYNTVCEEQPQDPCAGTSLTSGRRVAAATCVDDPMGGTESPPGDGTGCGPTNCQGESPILVDLDRGGFRLTSLAGGVRFDINGDGERENLSWTRGDSDDAFLALDRNGNGRIDHGRELFGDATPQPATSAPNGFLALHVFDRPAEGGNGDGLISGADAVFSRLLLWQDVSHDGVSDGDEISTLTHSGVVSIELDYVESRRRDRHGNEARYASRVKLDRATTQAADVFFVVD